MSRFWWALFFVAVGIEVLCALALFVELVSPGTIGER